MKFKKKVSKGQINQSTGVGFYINVFIILRKYYFDNSVKNEFKAFQLKKMHNMGVVS